MSARFPVLLLAGVTLLGGCSSFSPDGGFAPIEQAARDRLGKGLQWARSDADRDAIKLCVAELLAKPLTVDASSRASTRWWCAEETRCASASAT